MLFGKKRGRDIDSSRAFHSLKKTYRAHLSRKESEIAELGKKNQILMKTALRQSEKARELEELIKRLQKRIEALEKINK